MPVTSTTISYLRVGARRFPFMIHERMEDGSEYAVFPLHGAGLHISVHPRSDPHLKDRNATYSRLDLRRLATVDWDSESKEFMKVFESRFYWPQHRADLIAIPGPPGKTLIEGLVPSTDGPEVELDLVAYFRLLFTGVWFKVGYGVRRSFFETDVGKGSLIIDPREEGAAFYLPMYPDKPLLRIREGENFPMHPILQGWKNALDYQLNASIEEIPSHYVDELLAELEKELVKLEPEIQRLKVVRWKPGMSQSSKLGRVRLEASG